jgi:3-dehydroquinate synthase
MPGRRRPVTPAPPPTEPELTPRRRDQPRAATRRFVVLVAVVSVLVALPFLIWGEPDVAAVASRSGRSTAALVMLAIAALSIDAIAPVPATLVLAVLAHEAGVWAGIIGGTVGLTLGVVGAWMVGALAVRRIAPRVFTAAEYDRLARSTHRHSTWTLICLRSVPIAAETSVMMAAAAGMPLRKTLGITLLPNLVMATAYSVAADTSWTAAIVTLVVTILLSYGGWRLLASGKSG